MFDYSSEDEYWHTNIRCRGYENIGQGRLDEQSDSSRQEQRGSDRSNASNNEGFGLTLQDSQENHLPKPLIYLSGPTGP